MTHNKAKKKKKKINIKEKIKDNKLSSWNWSRNKNMYACSNISISHWQFLQDPGCSLSPGWHPAWVIIFYLHKIPLAVSIGHHFASQTVLQCGYACFSAEMAAFQQGVKLSFYIVHILCYKAPGTLTHQTCSTHYVISSMQVIRRNSIQSSFIYWDNKFCVK